MTEALQREYKGCPLCRAAQGQQPRRTADCTEHMLWHEPLPKTVEWLRCDACTHVYTRCYWTDAGLREVFSLSQSSQLVGGDPDEKRAGWANVVTTAIRHLGGYASAMSGEKPIWLDVGCGDGALAMLANEAGFVEVGLDARPNTAQALGVVGYRGVAGDFQKTRLDRKPRVISMMDVLEHLPFPTDALRHAASSLTEDGLLIISLPNLDAFSWRMYDKGAGSPYWWELEHHHNFTLERLVRLLKSVGFEPVEVNFPTRYRAQIEVYAKPGRGV
jgi:SAM-dependent methyltransferase